MLAVGILNQSPINLRDRSIPEWLELAESRDSHLAAELWAIVDRFERNGMVHGTIESDARQTLDTLRATGYRLAVLTNNSLLSAEAALERFDLRSAVDLVLARGVVEALKPDGAGVAQAHAALGGGPTACVGDAYIDGLAAQRAGIGARFIAFRATPAEFAARGVHVWRHVDQLADIPALLGSADWSGTVPPL